MSFNTFYNKIITDDNLMETIKHGSDQFPFQFYYDNLSLFDFHCIEWHWHDELEFVYVEKGPITFCIADKQFDLPTGSGIFINSKVLHRFFSQGEGIMPNFVCLPVFLSPEKSLIYTQYVSPVITSGLDFVSFSPDIAWQAQVLSLFREIISLCEPAAENELLIASAMQNLWHLIYQNTAQQRQELNARQKNGALARLQLIMQYMHVNYTRTLSLEELCQQAHISKSTVLNLFHQYLHTTPIQYLIKYRLQTASHMLTGSDRSISRISADCGFDNVDYFCKTFKKHYGMTPLQYRLSK